MVSSPEHPVPEYSRAYLTTDDHMSRHAAAWTAGRPALPDDPPDEPEPDRDGRTEPGELPADDASGQPEPESVLWEALCFADDKGAAVADLMAACGIGRSWVYSGPRKLAAWPRGPGIARRVVGRPWGLAMTCPHSRPRARARVYGHIQAMDMDMPPRQRKEAIIMTSDPRHDGTVAPRAGESRELGWHAVTASHGLAVAVLGATGGTGHDDGGR